MYSRHLALSVCVFSVFTFISWHFSVQVTSTFAGHLITFFSIVFGFYLTAFSVLYGSGFTKRLSDEEDPLKTTQTKLHTLTSYLKISSITSISSIVAFLLLLLLKWTVEGDIASEHLNQCPDNLMWTINTIGVNLCIKDILIAVSLGWSAVNIVFMGILLKILLNAFIEEGGKK